VVVTDGDGDAVPVGVGDGDPPLHATPLTAKSAGMSFEPENVAWNPKLTVPPAATDPS
jgi:hypothetical protein